MAQVEGDPALVARWEAPFLEAKEDGPPPCGKAGRGGGVPRVVGPPPCGTRSPCFLSAQVLLLLFLLLLLLLQSSLAY